MEKTKTWAIIIMRRLHGSRWRLDFLRGQLVLGSCFWVLPVPRCCLRLSIKCLKPNWCSSTLCLKASICAVQRWWVKPLGAAGAFGSGSVQELNEDHRVGSHNGSTPGRLLLSLPSVSTSDNVAGSEGGSIEVKSESSKKVSSTLRLLFTFPILLEGPTTGSVASRTAEQAAKFVSDALITEF